MTVASTTTKVSYSGNGSTTVFTVPFYFLAAADLRVILRSGATETVQTLTTQYTVTGAGVPSGGSVTMLAAPASGTTLTILRNVSPTQETDLLPNDRLPAESLETALDKATMLIQQLDEVADRALQYPASDAAVSPTLPAASARASKFLSFDANGLPTATVGVDSSLDVFIQAGTGAVARSVTSKLRDTVSVKDFGAVGDGVTDDTAAIQATINAVIYNNTTNPVNGLKKRVYLPAGKYRITDTLHLGYGTANVQYTSCDLEGDGAQYRADNSFSGTSIIADFNDRPAINVQGGRGNIISNLCIKGRNSDYVTSNQLGSILGTLNGIDDTVAANWVNPAFPASAGSRYAPYAGITIDAYCGPAPATAYPAVSYPSFLGAQTQYNKALSSDVMVDNCYIDGFVVGVASKPSDADENADYTVIRRTAIERCQYGISIGNTQSRAVHLDDVKCVFVHTALTTNKHGKQNGKLNGTISNFNVGAATQIFDLNSSAIYGPVTFLHAYAESLWRLGSITAENNSESSLIFQSCKFSFDNMGESSYNPTGTRGVPGKLLSGAQDIVMDVRFIGCVLTQFVGVAALWQRGVKLEGTLLNPRGRDVNLNLATQAYIATAHNALAGGLVTPNMRAEPDQRIKFIAYNLDTAAISGATISQDGTQTSTRVTCIPYFTWFAAASNEPYSDHVRTPRCVRSSAKSSLTVSLSNRTLTVTFAGRTDADFGLYGPDNGDIIVDDQTGMTFFVRSRTTTTVTAEAQNNYKPSGATFVPIEAFSTTTGNFYWMTGRVYTPEFYLRGDTASGSASISNCARDDGFAAWYDAQIAVNDRAYVAETQDNWLSSANSLISARDQGAGTITLGGNASRTETRRRLALFVRQPPSNA